MIRGDAETQGRIVMGDLKSRISMQSFAESTKAPVAVNGTYGGKPMMKLMACGEICQARHRDLFPMNRARDIQ